MASPAAAATVAPDTAPASPPPLRAPSPTFSLAAPMIYPDAAAAAETASPVAAAASAPPALPFDPTAREFDAFLSHNWAHKPVVEAFAALLKERGVRVWVDHERMTGNMKDTIAAALANSCVVIAFLSRHYLASWICREELRIASQDPHTRIVPVRLEVPPFADDAARAAARARREVLDAEIKRRDATNAELVSCRTELEVLDEALKYASHYDEISSILRRGDNSWLYIDRAECEDWAEYARLWTSGGFGGMGQTAEALQHGALQEARALVDWEGRLLDVAFPGIGAVGEERFDLFVAKHKLCLPGAQLRASNLTPLASPSSPAAVSMALADFNAGLGIMPSFVDADKAFGALKMLPLPLTLCRFRARVAVAPSGGAGEASPTPSASSSAWGDGVGEGDVEAYGVGSAAIKELANSLDRSFHVVAGVAGAGKTCLLRVIARCHGSARKGAPELYMDMEGGDFGDFRRVILLRLRDLESRFGTEKWARVKDTLRRSASPRDAAAFCVACAYDLTNDAANTRALADNLFDDASDEARRTLWLLDGFDELDADERARATALARFALGGAPSAARASAVKGVARMSSAELVHVVVELLVSQRHVLVTTRPAFAASLGQRAYIRIDPLQIDVVTDFCSRALNMPLSKVTSIFEPTLLEAMRTPVIMHMAIVAHVNRGDKGSAPGRAAADASTLSAAGTAAPAAWAHPVTDLYNRIVKNMQMRFKGSAAQWDRVLENLRRISLLGCARGEYAKLVWDGAGAVAPSVTASVRGSATAATAFPTFGSHAGVGIGNDPALFPLAESAGVIDVFIDRTVEFAHRSLQEFFAAQVIENSIASDRSLTSDESAALRASSNDALRRFVVSAVQSLDQANRVIGLLWDTSGAVPMSFSEESLSQLAQCIRFLPPHLSESLECAATVRARAIAFWNSFEDNARTDARVAETAVVSVAPASLGAPVLSISPANVVVSRSWKFKEKSDSLAQALVAAGFNVWLDVESITPGVNRREEFAKAVARACVVILCISEDYAKSTNCRIEAQYARARNKTLVICNVGSDGYMPSDADAAWLDVIVMGMPIADCRTDASAASDAGQSLCVRAVKSACSRDVGNSFWVVADALTFGATASHRAVETLERYTRDYSLARWNTATRPYMHTFPATAAPIAAVRIALAVANETFGGERSDALMTVAPALCELSAEPKLAPKMEARACPSCLKYFSVVRWKHHCRRCGFVYCADCAPKRVSLTTPTAVRLCKDCDSECSSGTGANSALPFGLPRFAAALKAVACVRIGRVRAPAIVALAVPGRALGGKMECLLSMAQSAKEDMLIRRAAFAELGARHAADVDVRKALSTLIALPATTGQHAPEDLVVAVIESFDAADLTQDVIRAILAHPTVPTEHMTEFTKLDFLINSAGAAGSTALLPAGSASLLAAPPWPIAPDVVAGCDVIVSRSWGSLTEGVYPPTRISSLMEKSNVLARALVAAGFSVWLDTEQIFPGANAREEFAKAVARARVVVLCISEDYALSTNCRFEAQYARARKKTLVICNVGSDGYTPSSYSNADADKHAWLDTIIVGMPIADCRTNASAASDAGKSFCVKAVEAALSRTPKPPPPASSRILGLALLRRLEEKDSREAFRLLEQGADFLDVSCPDGESTLTRACEFFHVDIATRVIEAATGNVEYLDRPNKRGETALMFAAERGLESVIRLLIAGGANVNATNRDGETALTSACLFGHAQSALVLLQNGADPAAKTATGLTPIQACLDCETLDKHKNVDMSSVRDALKRLLKDAGVMKKTGASCLLQ